MASDKQKTRKKPSFESVISEIDVISTRLQDPDICLNEALSLFEKGIELTHLAQSQLASAEQLVLDISELEKREKKSRHATTDK